MRITEKHIHTCIHADGELKVARLWLPPTVHTETKSKTRPKKATSFDDTSASVLPVNVFDPEMLPCDELVQLSCKETELQKRFKKLQPERQKRTDRGCCVSSRRLILQT